MMQKDKASMQEISNRQIRFLADIEALDFFCKWIREEEFELDGKRVKFGPAITPKPMPFIPIYDPETSILKGKSFNDLVVEKYIKLISDYEGIE